MSKQSNKKVAKILAALGGQGAVVPIVSVSTLAAT